MLGIELTATPKTVGTNPRQFVNIIYHYPLSRALQDGYVKIPAVATRKNFRADQVSAERLEEIKLEDGIHHHEFVKVELENYARTYEQPVVKPFMLVVAQDTAHASALKAKLESASFFNGHYQGRVIEAHSMTERLIELTIDIPQIAVLPTREVNYHFQAFTLEGLEKIAYQPVSQELLLLHLEDNQQARIQWEGADVQETRPEDYIVRQLVDQDAIDYDEHADLLYGLAAQVVARLREHLGGDEDKLENVLIYWQRQLGEFVWAQMQRHVWVTPTDYIGKVTQGF